MGDTRDRQRNDWYGRHRAACLLVVCAVWLTGAQHAQALTPTHTHTPHPACTPPLCQPGEVFHCPDVCPLGCGTVCVTPTPTVTPTATPSSIVNEPPSVDSLTSPTNRCSQTLRGTGRALFCGRLGGVFVVDADEIDKVVDCTFGRYEVTVGLDTNRINRFSVCQTGGVTGGGGGCQSVEIEQIFVGDCDDDTHVTVDEIVTMVVIALGERPMSACEHGDGDANQQVTVDEITTAAINALDGCLPATRYPDLVPSSAHETCPNGCGPYRVELCVVNAGDVASGPFGVAINDSQAGDIDGLGANQEVCVEVPYRFPSNPELPATAAVDSGGAIVEVDETNNTLEFPRPNPTGCDIICTPTPVP